MVGVVGRVAGADGDRGDPCRVLGVVGVDARAINTATKTSTTPIAASGAAEPTGPVVDGVHRLVAGPHERVLATSGHLGSLGVRRT